LFDLLEQITGYFMESKTLPVSELRLLLAGVSEHGAQHLIEVEADLMQTTFLLSEAIEKLGASFMAIHEAVTDQQQELEVFMTRNEWSKEDVKKLDGFKQKIGEEVNAAVTGLQFQDLTSQLITRTIKRVNGLKELLSALASHGQEIDAEHEHEEIAKLLEEMNHSLSTRSNALEGGLRRAVNQQDMGSGEIELF
jgi:hypothetical protein